MTLFERLTGVLRLSPRAFEDIESDKGATSQAFGVVVFAGVSAGLGGWFDGGGTGLVLGTVGKVVGWVMWAGVTYVLGARLMPEPDTRTDMGELLRVIGFSYAPDAFSILGLIPRIGIAVESGVACWQLATTVLAVRQALDYRSTGRAVIVVVTGWLIFVAIPWLVLHVEVLFFPVRWLMSQVGL